MLDVVNSSTGQDVITGRYGTGFALGLLAKDVGIAAWLGFGAGHSEAHKQWWPIDLAAEAP